MSYIVGQLVAYPLFEFSISSTIIVCPHRLSALQEIVGSWHRGGSLICCVFVLRKIIFIYECGWYINDGQVLT